MDTSGADGWHRDSAWPDALGVSRRIQVMLERTEATLRRSASALHASGQADRARQVERYAGWARFDLDEPLVAQRLYLAAARLRRVRQLDLLVGLALDDVLSLARADRGNVQLADQASGVLRIVAHHGFDAEFLHHFAVVDDDGSACGRAAAHGTQLLIADVTTDRSFAPHRDIAAASGFRAVQSTPLADGTGRLVGVFSTHYPHPYAPPPGDMRILQRYADLLGQVLAARLGAASPAESVLA
jgi:GAF domain-containing protein